MTRINIISPSELTDQHLIAEYREIFMVAGSLKRTLISKSGFVESKVPKNFTLNNGHVYFFYNKGKYLYKRYNLIIKEMKSRGFNPDENRVFPKDIFIMNNLFNDWEPNQSDIKIIRKRINEKIAMKPSWYRKTKNK
ncbi:MAG: pyrimidine dimer DNA glycosylase/endonuclease V [Bacteroidota bacterium]|nr:pyrimidine dimer DNA glycosylase/endonuclease V [Bacteroidota bacterium]